MKSSQADFKFFFNYELPVAVSYRELLRTVLASLINITLTVTISQLLELD
jgi:hypothetical protein